jgi:hypothetical protein
MGPIRCRETLVKDHHSTLHNTPEERRSHHILVLFSQLHCLLGQMKLFMPREIVIYMILIALWHTTVVVFSNFMVYSTFTAPEKFQWFSSFLPSSVYTAQTPDVHIPQFSVIVNHISMVLLLCIISLSHV